MQKRWTRITTITIRKPKPRVSFDFIHKSRCVRGNSFEDHIVSMLSYVPRSSQPNQPTNSSSIFFQMNQVTKQQQMLPTPKHLL
jgi:hypothetical protein